MKVKRKIIKDDREIGVRCERKCGFPLCLSSPDFELPTFKSRLGSSILRIFSSGNLRLPLRWGKFSVSIHLI
ncbi:hypothetical protein AKJ16_DCAP22829 [Drosera capensis]